MYTLKQFISENFTQDQIDNINKKTKILISISDIISDMIELRISSGKSMDDVAKIMGVKNSFISRIERGHTDIRISTLADYVNAIGGEIIIK